MSILKRIQDSKNDRDALEKIIKYVTKKPYTVWETDVETIGCRKEAALQDMRAVKHAFHKTGGRQYEHAVLSITPDFPSLKDSDYMEIGRRVALHCVGFQCIIALHRDTKTRHLHFVWNTISYKDGKRFTQGPPGLHQEKIYINHVLEQYDLDPVRSNTTEMIDTDFHDINYPLDFLEIFDDVPDDREMFNAPPPETQNNNEEFIAPTSNWADAYATFGNFGGNLMKYSRVNTPAQQYRPPVLTQTSSMTAGNTARGNGLNLVNVNNIKLASMNDLSQATSDLNDSFNSSARAGATALSTMRRNGIDEGVTITTINNFVIGGEEEPNRNHMEIIDTSCNE